MSTPEPRKVDVFSLPNTNSDTEQEVARMIGEGGRDDSLNIREIIPITQPRAAILQTAPIAQPRAAIAQVESRSTTSRRGSSQGFDPFRTDDPDDYGKGID